MRLFMANKDIPFPAKEVSKRSKIPLSRARKELSLLTHAGLLKQKQTTYKNRKTKGWQLNDSFHLLKPLSLLLSGGRPEITRKLIQLFKPLGRIRLLIVSGIFLGRDDTRADLLVVGDSLRPPRIEALIKKIEAELGKEIVYAVCDTNEFLYRLHAYDKFIRDILDYPHETLLDKMGGRFKG
jgi:hypothetical protein